MHKLYIQKYIALRENTVIENGKQIFSTEKEDTINQFLKKVYKENSISYSKYFKMDRLSKLGFISSELLLKDLLPEVHNPEEYGMLLANSSASLDTDVKFQESLNTIPSPAVFVYTLANIVIGEVCIRHNFKGECSFFIQDEWDTKFTTNYSQSVVQTTNTKNFIVAWVDVNPQGEYNSFFALVNKHESDWEFNEETINELYKK